MGVGGGGGGGLPDCLPQGTGLCGPQWDRDGDTISTNTETNGTNNVSSGGFYTFSVSAWDLNLSEARGLSVGSGTLFKGMNLRDDGDGYNHYQGFDPPDYDDWGTGHMVRLIEGTGRNYWKVKLPADALMQVGDLSLKLGGYFDGHPAHVGHTNGREADFRYLRNDGAFFPLDICENPEDYDEDATFNLLSGLITAQGDMMVQIEAILVDLNCINMTHPLFVHDAGHSNHFHVRIVDPDGINN